MDKEKVTEREAMEMYDEMLNEQGLIDVCGYKYEPAQILKEVDPIAYREGFWNYVDASEIELEEY